MAIEDRTEVKRAERGRDLLLTLEHDARTRAEAADQLKDQFVATASHELRGPLTVISGWMNVLLEAGPNVDPLTLGKALAAIGRGVTAQGRLISDLLDHAQIVAGKVALRRAPIDLSAVAEAAMIGVQAAADAKDIDLQLTRDGSPCIVLGDFDRMQQVFWNLFLNAVKFTPPRGYVGISIGRVVGQVEVSVRDSGCGITSEFLPHVFDRFRQAEGSSARLQPGLGLGLTLVRELVELHGGTVRAESAGKDRGATFTVVLPIPALLMQAEEPEARAVQPAAESQDHPSAPGARRAVCAFAPLAGRRPYSGRRRRGRRARRAGRSPGALRRGGALRGVRGRGHDCAGLGFARRAAQRSRHAGRGRLRAAPARQAAARERWWSSARNRGERVRNGRAPEKDHQERLPAALGKTRSSRRARDRDRRLDSTPGERCRPLERRWRNFGDAREYTGANAAAASKRFSSQQESS